MCEGESIVDITLVTPWVLDRLSRWQVVGEVETLSDHCYIVFRVGPRGLMRTRPAKSYPRWAWGQLDEDKFRAVLEWYGAEPLDLEHGDIDGALA